MHPIRIEERFWGPGKCACEIDVEGELVRSECMSRGRMVRDGFSGRDFRCMYLCSSLVWYVFCLGRSMPVCSSAWLASIRFDVVSMDVSLPPNRLCSF